MQERDSLSSTPTRPARPQYHYFYGSTDSVSSSQQQQQPPGSPSTNQQEIESLIGEALVHTDTEEEGYLPVSHEFDLQHVVVTTNNGHHHHHSQERSSKPLLARLKSSLRRFRRGVFIWRDVTRLLVLLASVTACLLLLGMVVYTHVIRPLSQKSAAELSSSQQSHVLFQPFPSINRAAATAEDPVVGFLRAELFHPDLLCNPPKQPNEKDEPLSSAFMWKARPASFLKVPFPTGAFWTNLVLVPTADRGFSYPIVAYPYSFKWNDALLQASYPSLHRRLEADFVQDTHYPDITFGVVENVVTRNVVNFDPLSVTLRFSTNNGLWESYLVQGSPYITIRYVKTSPMLQALSIFKNVVCPQDEDDTYKYGICNSQTGDDPNKPELTLRGVQFILQTQEGLSWFMFASEPINLVFDTLRRTTVISQGAFTGVIRLALVPPDKSGDGGSSTSGKPQTSATGLRRLIYHAGTYPVGASVSWEFRSEQPLSLVELTAKKTMASTTASATTATTTTTTTSTGSRSSNANRVGTVLFRFTTKKMTESVSARPNGVTDTLLMLALPHHVDVLSKDAILNADQFDLVYRCIKGNMTPVLGATWQYDEPLLSIGFDDVDVIGYSRTVDPSVRNAIVFNLAQDLNRVLPTRDENVYGFGKQAARLAQLVHIANVLNRTNTTTATSGNDDEKFLDPLPNMLEGAIATLSSFLTDFLSGQVVDSLVFDASLGGIVSKKGMVDSSEDFGNGRYNDHHFHYGYLLYACAILGKLNSTFVRDYGKYVDTIMNDVAYMSNPDSETMDNVFFPLTRHKSWFDGHSFASGLFPFGNGKSQESSSEAVNCYYSAYLWSLVRNRAALDPDSDDSEGTNFLRLVLATEIRSAKTYWHMMPPESSTNQTKSMSVLYNSVFLKEGGMNGNLGMLDVDRSTWFGTQRLYVHMINFLPVTAATAALFTNQYVSKEYSKVLSLLPSVEMAWRGYVVADHAIVDPMKAWGDAQELVSYELDAAISKSQVLYWISTREGFNFTGEAVNSTSPSTNPVTMMCEANAACSEVGLTGFCCPTEAGVSLDCCNT